MNAEGAGGRTRVLQQTLWLLVDRGLRLLITFGVGVWIARHLEPAQYGTLSYANGTVALLAFLATLGLEAVVVKMLAAEPQASGEILASALVLRAAGGIALIVIATVAVRALQPESPVLVWITPLVAAATLLQSVEVLEYWLRQRLRVRNAVIGRQVCLVAGAGARIMATQGQNPVLALAAVQAAEALLLALVMLGVFRSGERGLGGFRPRRERMVALLAQAAPLLVSAVAVSVYVRLSVIVVGDHHGPEEVAVFAVATLLSEATHALPVAVMAIQAPLLLRVDGAFERRWPAVLRRLIMLGMVIAGALTLLAEPLVRVLLGEPYLPSAPVLKVQIWSALFVFMSVASEPWFLRESRLSYYPAKTGLAAAASVVAAFALIPRFGALGAAWATVIAYSVSAYWSNAIFPGTRALFRRQTAALFMPLRP